jgi:hypothetical protein
VKKLIDTVDTKDYGSIGCFRTKVNIGQPAFSTACSFAKARYLALSLQSVDEAQVGFDATKSLLEKAAALRK